MQFIKRLLFLVLITTRAIGQDVSALMKEGIALHDKGEYARAIIAYKKAIELDPNNGGAYYEMAYSYHSLRDLPNALDAVEKALPLASGKLLVMSLILKGSVLDDSGKPLEALKLYEEVTRQNGDEPMLWFNYGVTLEKVRRYDDAEAAFTKALSLNFFHPGSHLQLGNLKKKLGGKATAAMCYYFFLLLESESERSKVAATSLLDLMQPPPVDSITNGIQITIPATESADYGALELSFSILGLDPDSKSVDARTTQEKFVADTKSFFTIVGELSEKPARKAKKKKKKAQGFDPWWQGYAPLFADIQKAGHTEAYCYTIMKATQEPEVENWLASNIDKTDEFISWIRQRK